MLQKTGEKNKYTSSFPAEKNLNKREDGKMLTQSDRTTEMNESEKASVVENGRASKKGIKRFFPRQPLSVFSKTAVAMFIGMVILGCVQLFFASLDQVGFVVAMMLMGAVLILTRVRWMPLVGTLLAGLFLGVLLFKEPLPAYYIGHAKDSLSIPSVSFMMFVLYVLTLSFLIIAFISGILAFIYNYWQSEEVALGVPGKARTPRWFTSSLTALVGVMIGMILLGALLPMPGTTISNVGTETVPLLVHVESNTFAPSSVKLAAGSTIILLSDSYSHHNISYGSWVNGQARPEQQASAPTIDNGSMDVAAQTLEIGKFETPGTYHLYSTVNPGMMLTIVVQ